MPLVPDDDIALGVTTAPVLPDDPEAASMLDTLRGAGTLYNWPYRAYRDWMNRAGGETDLEHDPFSVIKGTKYEGDPERFAFSHNEQETRAIMREWDQDDEATDALSRSGWFGTVAGVGASMLDPTIFLPIGKVFSGAAQGYRMLRVAADGAVANAVAGAVSEYGMYSTTPHYEWSDVATGIGIDTVVGGILGAGVGLLSKAERVDVGKKLQADREEWGNDLQVTQPAAAGATISDTRELELDLPGIVQKVDPTQKFSPSRRMLMSPSNAARRATADLVETPYIFKENAEGVATTQGPALDRLARMRIEGGRIEVARDLDELYYKYRQGKAPKLGERTLLTARDLIGRDRSKATYSEFKEMVDDALRGGDQHDIPEVAEAAKRMRTKILAPWRDEAIKAGLLPEGVDPKTADSYMMRVWNKEKLTARRPDARRIFADWFEGQQSIKSAIQERVAKQADEIKAAREQVSGLQAQMTAREMAALVDPARADEVIELRAQLDAAQKRHETLRGDLEAAISEWEGKSTREAKSALKTRGKAEAVRDPEAEGRLAAADRAVDTAAKRIVNSNQRLSRQELEALADEVVNRIIGSPDGRLPYESASPNSSPGAGGDKRGPLASREFMIPDTMVRDFIDKDVQNTADLYLRTMVPDVLLTQRFGDVDMTEAFRKIDDDYNKLFTGAKDESERAKFEKRRQADIETLADLRDRIRGTLGYSSTGFARKLGRISATVAKFDVLTNLGGVVLSSLPDLAGMQWRYGLTSTFRNAWRPMFKMLGDKELRAAMMKRKGQLQSIGIAADTYLNLRGPAMGDVTDIYRPTSRLERGVSYATSKFQLFNGLSYWTDATKFMAGTLATKELSEAVLASAAGTPTKRHIRNLAEAGIDGAMAQRIAGMLAEPGGSDVVKGIRLPNTESWTDLAARDAFEGAVARDVDMMILTPGAEKPIMMSKYPALGLILQYRGFVAAAHERLLMRGMMQRDINVIHGLVSGIVLGMVAEYANGLAAGRDLPDASAVGDWVKVGVNRSGALGWYSDGNSTMEKLTGLDAFRAIGATKRDARYISRSKLAALLGPTAGKLEAIMKVSGDVASGKWTASDTKAIRRLMVGQNLFYVRQMLDKLEGGVNSAVGVEPFKD